MILASNDKNQILTKRCFIFYLFFCNFNKSYREKVPHVDHILGERSFQDR